MPRKKKTPIPPWDAPSIAAKPTDGDRHLYLGGTDVGAIVGVNPWSSPMAVWLEKTRRSGAKADNRAMRLGRNLEPVLRAEYEEETGHPCLSVERRYYDEEHPFLVAHPDAWDTRTGEGIELKTAKWTQRRFWGEPDTDDLPDHYLVQCMWYMGLTKQPYWKVRVLFGGSEYLPYLVRFDPVLFESLKEVATRFWYEHVLPDVAPAVDGGEASASYLASVYPKATAERRPASDVEEERVARYLWLKQGIDRGKIALEQMRNELVASIGPAKGLETSFARLSLSDAIVRHTVDWKAIATHLCPDETNLARLIEAHTKYSEPYRTLRDTILGDLPALDEPTRQLLLTAAQGEEEGEDQ